MRLSVQIEFDKTLDLETNKKEVTIGRSPQCDLVIPHDGVSRRHCKIEIHNGQFFITDLGSSNGVFIDGVKITQNERKAFLSTQQLKLGGLECEVTESHGGSSEHKIISSTVAPGGDFTATVRLARIDLNKPSQTLELEKRPKSQRPRNPITAQIESEPEVVKSSNKGLLVLLVIIAVALAWYFGPEVK